MNFFQVLLRRRKLVFFLFLFSLSAFPGVDRKNEKGDAAASSNLVSSSPLNFLSHRAFVRALEGLKDSNFLILDETVKYEYPLTQLDEAKLQQFGLEKQEINRVKNDYTDGNFKSIHLKNGVNIAYLVGEKSRASPYIQKIKLQLQISVSHNFEPPTGYLTREFTLKIKDKTTPSTPTLGHIVIQEGFSKDQAYKELYIREVSIQPSSQGRGYGTEAMREMTQFLDHSNIEFREMTLSLQSDKSYTGLIYAKVGFMPDEQAIQRIAEMLEMPVYKVLALYLMNSLQSNWPLFSEDKLELFGKPITQKGKDKIISVLDDLRDMKRKRGYKGLDLRGQPTLEELEKLLDIQSKTY